MDDNAKSITDSLFGGKLIEIKEQDYRFLIRIYESQHKVSIKIEKNNYRIYHHKKDYGLDIFGDLFSFLQKDYPDIKQFEEKLYGLLVC